jgi:trans-2-enoyl-CoA reductase
MIEENWTRECLRMVRIVCVVLFFFLMIGTRIIGTLGIAVRTISVSGAPKFIGNTRGIYMPSTRASISLRTLASSSCPPSWAFIYEEQGPPDHVTRLVDLPPVDLKENDVCAKCLLLPSTHQTLIE